jgi:glycosyltransferase involved in cell wall biosynthesis
MAFLAILTILATMLWIGAGWRAALAGRRFQEPRTDSPLPDPPPRVALIAPARNEAELLPSTFPTLLAQDYPNLSITVVNDCSEDDTGPILRLFAAGDARVTVVEGVERPEGWVGKTWAIHQGVEIAGRDADWLMLVDSDIAFDPRAVRVGVAEALRLGVPLYSLLPSVECRTFWQQNICTAIGIGMVSLFPFDRVNDQKCSKALAAGGFSLIRRSIYDEIGGEYALRHEITEDVRRGEMVKGAGYPIFLSITRDLARTHFYGSLGDIWTGLRKNIYAVLKYSPWKFLAGTVCGLPWLWLPCLGTVIGAWQVAQAGFAGWPAWLLVAGAVGWLVQTFIALPLSSFFHLPAYHAPLFPIGATAFWLIGCTSVWDYYFGGGPRWKNRVFNPASFPTAATNEPTQS